MTLKSLEELAQDAKEYPIGTATERAGWALETENQRRMAANQPAWIDDKRPIIAKIVAMMEAQ